MAEILGKDLDNYDESLAAKQPFSLSESDTAEPKFMTGADLIRSAKISADWKDPIAIRTQAYTPVAKLSQPILSGGRFMVDSLVNLPSNIANLVAQGVLESTGRYEPIVDVVSILADKNKREKLRKAFEENQESLDETIKLLSGRDYSVDKWARRVIANSTANVENRNLVRELYNQSQGIDSSKWYNEAGAIIGAMVPTMAVGNTAFATSRAFGAGRAAATKIATNVAKGYIGAEMAGQYAEETAAQYLQRTGDKNFENFTAKDASGLSAAAYGAIGAQIEFIGGVEPIMAGALTKVGLRSAGLKAAAKIGIGEATEELLQGLTETLFRKIEGTTDKTWKEGFEDSLKGAAWGLFIGGTMGTTAFYVNRRNLVKGIKTALPNISDTEAQLVADAMIDNTAEMSSQDPTLRANLRQKVALMYRDSDIDNKDNIIDATTDLEYSLIAMDAIDRGIEITDHELFQGVVNELGWFRDNIPEERRAEIQSLNDEIVALKDQLAKENAQEEKNWEKIEEIENKLDKFNSYVLDKLSDLARADANSVRRMLRGVEQQYVSKQKKKASLPTGEEAVFKVFPDEKFNAEEKHIEPYKYTHADNKFRYKDDGMHHVIELLDSDNNVLSAIEINKSNSGVNSINTFEENNWRKGYGSTLLREAERLFGDNLTVSPESTEWAQGFWKRKNRYTEEIRPSVFRKARQPMFQDQFDLADENARLDDIYPEYTVETIEVDGKERTVYNSNGERIAKSKEALTNFWRWFGNSKAVDKKGHPLVVYHGARGKTDITEFDPKKGWKVDATYFATNPSAAAHWSIASSETKRIFDLDSFTKKIKSTNSIEKLLEYYKIFRPEAYLTEEYNESANENWWWFHNTKYDVGDSLGVKIDDSKYVIKGNWGERVTDLVDRLQKDIIYYAKGAVESDLYGVYVKLENPLIVDAKKESYHNILFNGNRVNTETIVDYAQANNYDGVIVKNVYETDFESALTDDIIAFESTQIKSTDNRGTYSSDTGNIYLQNKVSGAAPSTYRGAYIPTYRFILRANKMDASTLSHELAHDWMETNFDRYREGKMSKDFMKSWGALEKALGIPEDATSVPRKASETFARAYEAWIVQNENWAKLISVDDKDKDAVEKLMKDYQGELRDIYNDITSPYFKQTWGKLGELKPELKAWFDRVVNITDLDVMVERGEMTEEQAANEKLNRTIDTVIETTTDEETKQALTEAKVLNDPERYEVEGGNQNSIQRRLSNLAKEIDENNMASKGDKYDTRRDMMAVAEAADNFVKTRLDDALAIINVEMAEVEGLYKEDLYTALERLAIENGDLGLIDELKNSEVANRLAKELGQRVAGFRNFKQSTDLDVVSALKSLDNKFNEALKNKKAKQEYDAALKLLDESMKQQDKIADKELDNFLDELKCK